MRNLRIALWALVAIAAVTVGWLTVERLGTAEKRARAVASLTSFGGPFEAVMASAGDPTPRPVTWDDWKGRPHAVFFGFTHCPEICPTTLYEAGQWLEALGPDGDDIDVYFVTVDPARDTPAYMADYLRAFDPRIKAVTGTQEQIAELVKAWRVTAEKVPLGDGEYNMNHTTTVFLMGADGELKSAINYNDRTEDAVAKLRRLLS